MAKSNTKKTASQPIKRTEAASMASPAGLPLTSQARIGPPHAANAPQGKTTANTAESPRHRRVTRASPAASPRPKACAAAAATAWEPPQARAKRSG
jgi:hypothetical protein